MTPVYPSDCLGEKENHSHKVSKRDIGFQDSAVGRHFSENS